MGIVAALGNTVENIVYATAVINIPFYARLVRAEVNIRREAGFALAAKLSGNSDFRVLAFHIFPNALPPMMVQVSLNLGWAILNAAGLSFIGLGVRPPTAEWGSMTLYQDDSDYIDTGAIKHAESWGNGRIDFQPWPYPSATRLIVEEMNNTVVGGDTTFLNGLDPQFVADDLVEYSYVKNALEKFPEWKNDPSVNPGDPFNREEILEL